MLRRFYTIKQWALTNSQSQIPIKVHLKVPSFDEILLKPLSTEIFNEIIQQFLEFLPSISLLSWTWNEKHGLVSTISIIYSTKNSIKIPPSAIRRQVSDNNLSIPPCRFPPPIPLSLFGSCLNIFLILMNFLLLNKAKA